jgi:hypothetical protein
MARIVAPTLCIAHLAVQPFDSRLSRGPRLCRIGAFCGSSLNRIGRLGCHPTFCTVNEIPRGKLGY